MRDDVVFRVWKAKPRTVLALFPSIDAGNGRCQSYEHIGQHCAADYQGCIATSRPAQPVEYKELYEELTRIGYELRVNKRRIRV
jgi:hypothetical protein